MTRGAARDGRVRAALAAYALIKKRRETRAAWAAFQLRLHLEWLRVRNEVVLGVIACIAMADNERRTVERASAVEGGSDEEGSSDKNRRGRGASQGVQCPNPLQRIRTKCHMHACHVTTYPYCIQGDADAVHIAAASCSCLRRGRREPPSRRRRPLPCPRRLPRCLPRSASGCCPQSRHRRLRGHTAVALAVSSQSRRRRRPRSRRCELRPSELSPSPPPSRARDSPSPPPSLVAHAAASCQRRTF